VSQIQNFVDAPTSPSGDAASPEGDVFIPAGDVSSRLEIPYEMRRLPQEISSCLAGDVMRLQISGYVTLLINIEKIRGTNQFLLLL